MQIFDYLTIKLIAHKNSRAIESSDVLELVNQTVKFVWSVAKIRSNCVIVKCLNRAVILAEI